MALPKIIRPPSLHAEVRVGQEVSRIYSDALGQWLDGVVNYTTYGGEPTNFDHPIARPLLPETDSSGENWRTVAQAKRFFLDRLEHTGGGEPRSIQVVFTNGHRDARWNEAVRGTLWGKIEYIPERPDLLRGWLGFSLLPDEEPDSSHITLLGGVFQGALSVLVFSDPLPSMIRRMPPKELARVINSGLPAKTRSRWRGLVQHLSLHGEMNELNGLLLLVHREHRDRIGNSRGAMKAGISTSMLESLQKSRHVGRPSRKSRFTVVSLDDDGAEVGEVADPSARIPSRSGKLSRATERLDARTLEVLRLYYEDDLDQAEIGEKIGVTQGRVSQILSAAYKVIRESLLP